ncbi:hypothetical protein KBX18_01935 [Corynebacterium sp. CCUG 69979]|uniref:hypothetical protein n=1 Tax=Corynebacterium sp. CCUG 69979 TaxID=2823890 RepID=UPI00210A0FD5|nr:hypothetical protein [Corynebacterium sp. CCUG 69979]MCQ4624332.1 hypothetical protein [Corynebacterium sp. CCUG 69979]
MGSEKVYTEQEQANDAMHRDFYSAQGAKLMLPKDFAVDTAPDWRMGLFSVIVPVSGRLGAAEPTGFEGWTRGRFRGVKSVQFPDDDGSGQIVRMTWGDTDNDDFDFVPRKFHEGVTSHFRSPLKESMGHQSVDAFASGDSEHVTARRYLFEADITQEDGKKYRKLPPMPDQPSEPRARFALVDPGHPFASLGLMCIEYLEYRGPDVHRLGSIRPEKDTEFKNSFLVFQVVVENCSSAMMDRVSRSLHKPREKVWLYPGSLVGELDFEASNLEVVWTDPMKGWLQQYFTLYGERYKENDWKRDGRAEVNPLRLFVEIASSLLFKEVKPEDHWIIADGGFLSVKKDKSSSEGTDKSKKDQEYFRPHTRSTYTVATAVPGVEDLKPPALLRSEDGESSGGWTSHDRWAWALASRADEYTSGIPSMNGAVLETSRVDVFQNWTMHSAERGLAIVRRTPRDCGDWGFSMLSATRYVDLAILARRASNYISEISNQLRRMAFGSEELDQLVRKDTLTEEEIDIVNRSLQDSLQDFEKIQMDLVRLRDHLWYETVSGKVADSELLDHILIQTGARDQYEDIVSEIELRKDVYATRSDNARIHVDRMTAIRQDRQNFLLAIAGIAFAVPGVIQLLPGAPSVTYFWYGVFGIAIFMAIAYVFLKFKPWLARTRQLFSSKDRTSTPESPRK